MEDKGLSSELMDPLEQPDHLCWSCLGNKGVAPVPLVASMSLGCNRLPSFEFFSHFDEDELLEVVLLFL